MLIILLLLCYISISFSQINVYFTDPYNKDRPSLSEISTRLKPIDFALKEFIESATPGTTVYICVYQVNNTTITTAIDYIVNRGVSVYAIFHKDVSTAVFKSSFSYKKIGSNERLMHNKFVVVKSSKVWTGSYNFTISATYEQDNFAIEIFSKDLAEIYEKAFLYMWDGSGVIGEFNNKQVILNERTKITVGFNPYSQNPELKDVLIENWYDKIEGKVKVRSLYFAVAWFTEQALKEILLKLVDNNVAVSGIVDDNASGNSVFTELRTKGVDIWYDSRHTLTSGDGLMHHKFCVVDPYGASPKVICGSANWSEQGLSSSTVGWNYENILVIESREVAEVFYKEFLRLYKKAVAEKVISTSDELVEDIIFYPNPVSKKLNIKFTPNRGVKEVKFLLISLYGIRMYEENLNFIAGVENKVEISIPNEIKEGLYYGILRVKSFEFSKDYVKKIIVR